MRIVLYHISLIVISIHLAGGETLLMLAIHRFEAKLLLLLLKLAVWTQPIAVSYFYGEGS